MSIGAPTATKTPPSELHARASRSGSTKGRSADLLDPGAGLFISIGLQANGRELGPQALKGKNVS